ncbi:MAG TPA: chitobiase/beta-hexosaminidase C-terminal domain-containing protein, partial [Opitutus sp.]|nr:chitobiase/beta-hexosaminidase C-terminal domain-containing protein [Opitutus sp.]
MNAFWSMSEVNVTNFKNNVSLVPNLAGIDARAENGAVIATAGNLLLRTPDDANFADPANYDYRILPGSAAIDIGVSLAAADFPVTTDIEGNARPQGSAYDAGISEAGALSVFLIASPPPSVGATGSVNASTIGGTPPYTYAWSNGAGTASITGVPEGLYQVTVTDSLGAQKTRATYLIPGAVMGAPVSVTPANQVFAPTFNAPPGTYLTGQSVALVSATAGAAIRYTTDGTNPSDTVGTLYSTPIVVDNTVTLKAIAYKAGMVNSTVETATYIIDNGPPNTQLTIAAVSESSHTSSNAPTNALDGNLGTSWASNGDGEWLQLDLGVPSRIGFLNIAVGTATSRSYYYDLQASNDGLNWSTILTGGRTPLNAGLQKHDINDVQPVRYLRIVMHGSNYSPTLNNIAEVEVWGGPAIGGGGEPPAAPTNLTAVSGDTVVTLEWDASTGANSYNVKRATVTGGPYETVAAGVATTNFSDNNVMNTTTYYYVVTGVNLYGASDDSNEASATPQGLPPEPSESISAAPADGHVVVSWSPAAKTDAYTLKRATTAGGPYTTVAADLITTVFADVGLTNGTTYYYVVSGTNVDGEGANSTETSATPQAGYAGVLHIL